MTEKQVLALMERIQSYFQSFQIKPYIIDEWYKVLSEYDNTDVNKQFDNHLKSESIDPPKLHLLIKHLDKTNEKRPDSFICKCKYCGSNIKTRVDLLNIKKHEDRCRSVQYLKKVYRKYLNREIENEDELYSMDDKVFNANYDQVLKKLLELPNLSESEQYCINKYFGNEANITESISSLAKDKKMEEMSYDDRMAVRKNPYYG